VILCDTGPLVALVDQDNSAHARCVAALNALPASPLLTTWPCLVEAMYLLWRAGGLPAQEELWGKSWKSPLPLATLTTKTADSTLGYL
jgi:predicted nucleic acid-binding protein